MTTVAGNRGGVGSRSEKEMRENCLAREVVGACCQYPDCDCFHASDYYEQHPEELMADDAKLKDIEDRKRELCAEFRRRLIRLLNEERRELGLVQHQNDEIEIYY